MTSKKLFPGHNMAIAHMNSLQLWLHSHALSKFKPDEVLTWTGWGGDRSGEVGPKSTPEWGATGLTATGRGEFMVYSLVGWPQPRSGPTTKSSWATQIWFHGPLKRERGRSQKRSGKWREGGAQSWIDRKVEWAWSSRGKGVNLIQIMIWDSQRINKMLLKKTKNKLSCNKTSWKALTQRGRQLNLTGDHRQVLCLRILWFPAPSPRSPVRAKQRSDFCRHSRAGMRH